MVSDYWNGYYKVKVQKKGIPSQFATFTIQEFSDKDEILVIDIGCGDGRDTSFFAYHGFQVIGIDGSIEAINKCKDFNTDEKVDYMCYKIEDIELYSNLEKRIISLNKKVVFYSRFFLHAITEKEQEFLINNLKKIMPKDSLFYLEFRTNRDEFQEKTTLAHFRRYISPINFATQITKAGLDILYFVEGFGYAKYKQDDAHVARFVLKLSN